MPYRLDIKRLFDDLGGPRQVANALTEVGVPIPRQTAQKWLERKGAGFDTVYLVNLIAHRLLMEGEPFDLTRYLTPVAPEDLLRPRASVAQRAAAARARRSRAAPC